MNSQETYLSIAFHVSDIFTIGGQLGVCGSDRIICFDELVRRELSGPAEDHVLCDRSTKITGLSPSSIPSAPKRPEPVVKKILDDVRVSNSVLFSLVFARKDFLTPDVPELTGSNKYKTRA